MGKAVFLDTVNRLVFDFWICLSRGVGTTLTLLALQLRQPWRDFVCGRFFLVGGEAVRQETDSWENRNQKVGPSSEMYQESKSQYPCSLAVLPAPGSATEIRIPTED
jgi:hypothetical protein